MSIVLFFFFTHIDTLSKTIKDDPLATLKQDALFIPPSSLQKQETIGQGIYV